MAISTREDEDRTSKFAAVLKSGPTGAAPPPRDIRRFRLSRWLTIGGVLVVILGVVAASVRNTLLGSGQATGTVLTERVRKSDLVVSIAEDGNVESAHNVDIKCEVQGGATILWLISDGSFVKKGDELSRLDSSLIEEKIDQQKITYEKAKALKIEADKVYESAQIAVAEYLEGTYVQTLQDLNAKATVAKENLETAKNLLLFTNKMARQGYVTPLQRDAQAFAVQRAELDLGVAQTAITVLEKFTRAKTQVGLESARDSAAARKASEQAACDLEEDRLKKMQMQLEKCTIYAADDGMVVYANEESQRRRGSSQMSPVEEGAMMRERQSIIKLPDLTRMQVKCTVHESKVDHLQRGMRARIRIQDREYQGVVTSVSNQPEPSDWFSGNVKQYAAIVSIDSDPHGLRPGMTAAVEVLVANLKDVLSVPVQAVVEKSGKFYCWVSTGTGIEKRPLVLGMSDNARIEIKDGVKEGDLVLLNPRATVEEAREDERTDEKVDVKKKFGDDKPAVISNAAGKSGGPDGARTGGKGKQGGGRPALDMKSLDKDGDGKLSKEEVPERMKEFFNTMDTDQDGFVSATELAEVRKKMQQMQQQGGDGPPGGGPGGPGGPRAPGAGP
jgi:HlyD family secretion protein